MQVVSPRAMVRRIPVLVLLIASVVVSVTKPWGKAVVVVGLLCSVLARLALSRTNRVLQLICAVLFFAGPTAWVWAALKIVFGSSWAASATSIVVWFGLQQSVRSWSRHSTATTPTSVPRTSTPPPSMPAQESPPEPVRRPHRKVRR